MLMRNLLRTTPGLPIAVLLIALGMACGGNKKPPVARPLPPPPPPTNATTAPPRSTAKPPEPTAERVPVPPEPVRDDAIRSASLDDLNRNSPLKPVFFEYDSSEITADGRGVLDGNAALLKQYPSWAITIEGHADERGTAEYNLALGERRAVSARTYLVSLGVPADRLRTVSYGKEFPFDTGHDEGSWSQNRRAHFMVTAK